MQARLTPAMGRVKRLRLPVPNGPYVNFVTALRVDLARRARDDPRMLIYKIFRADEWAALQAAGETDGAPIDVTDGYIHFSDSDTVARTAELYFKDEEGLVLLAVEAEGLDTLKWEASRGGALFPHLYRKLRLSDIKWHKPLPIVDGVHQFPELE